METKIELILRLLDEEKINFAEAFILAGKSIQNPVQVRDITPSSHPRESYMPYYSPGTPHWGINPSKVVDGNINCFVQKADLHPDLGGME